MEELYNAIVNKIKEAVDKKIFILPSIENYQIEESDYTSGGSTLYGKQYKIGEGKGDEYIIVTEECKDKCRTFQIKPDRNIVMVTLYKEGNQVKTHSDFWDDEI